MVIAILEHTIRDSRDFEKHVAYIHYNPVKHGHVKRVSEWPYPSFHRYARDGLVPMDWADRGAIDIGEI